MSLPLEFERLNATPENKKAALYGRGFD